MPQVVNYDALRTAYFNPSTGLRSAEALWRKLKPQYTLAQVKAYLQEQDVDQRFHERKNPKPYFPMSRGQVPFARCQQDLLDVRSLNPNKNQGVQYLMLTVDAYSKFLVCVPLKSKDNTDVVAGLKETICQLAAENSGFPPGVLDSDNEPAFTGRAYRAELKEDGVEQNLTLSSDTKALSYVNRVCRTVRILINKYREITRSSTYITGLPHLIQNYNSSWHRAINTTPQEATKQTQQTEQITSRIEKQKAKAGKQTFYRADIEVGSHVRALLPTKLFDKLSRARWPSHIYTVERIVAGVFFYLRGVPDHRYRKYELLLVSGPADGDESDGERDEESKSNDDEKYPVSDDEDEYTRQRRLERRIAREGFEPHQYSGDPTNSLEQRFQDELANLPSKRRRRNN